MTWDETVLGRYDQNPSVEEIMGDEDDHPPSKVPRNDTLSDLVEGLGASCRDLEKGFKSLCEETFCALFCLKLKGCNAGTGFGVSFSQAFCDSEFLQDKFYPFSAIFTTGVDLLYAVLKTPNGVKFEDERLGILIRRLLAFITDSDSRSFIRDLDRHASTKLKNETQVGVALVEHLFGKLSLRKDYTIDQRSTNRSKAGECQCGCGTNIKYRYGDTGTGQEAVWHGDLDMVFGAGEDRVPVVLAGKEDPSPGNVSNVEVNSKSINYPQIKHRMIAQTVVFSFLHRKIFPKSRHFLIPSIGVSAKEVIFFFYDSENDVLIQSVKMPLRSGKDLCYSTVIAIWMVLNYRYLGSGLTGLSQPSQSNFSNLVKDVIDIYRNDLSFGGIGDSFMEDTLYPHDIPEEKMVLSSEGLRFGL